MLNISNGTSPYIENWGSYNPTSLAALSDSVLKIDIFGLLSEFFDKILDQIVFAAPTDSCCPTMLRDNREYK